MDDIIYLIRQSYQRNEYGVRVPSEDRKKVFAKVLSVTRAEFFEGGRNGLNPQFRFDVFAADYHEETVVEYKGKRYSVYRVYRDIASDYLELYVERKGGTNGQA